MAALKAWSLALHSTASSSSSSSHQRGITNSTINVPKKVPNLSLPLLKSQEPELQNEKHLSPLTIDALTQMNHRDPMVVAKLYAILEAVADRVEMHTNIGEQRKNWNTLLLSSINSLTLSAAAMAAIAAIAGADHIEPIKISSMIMYVAATGMLFVVNKIQPSQLAEEQRNATRLFKQLQNQITTILSTRNPTDFDVDEMMDQVLALDQAYPLPLLGAMLDKFPATIQPAVWWPENRRRRRPKTGQGYNGWNKKLEKEMKEIVDVIRRKDEKDYLRLGGKALKLNKLLAMAAPLLTGLAAVGSDLVGSETHGGWAAALAVGGGALASVVNALEHGGQVGMVVEMYRSNAGFFKMVEESIESNLEEEDLQRRENGEMVEMKVALQLGRSLPEFRKLAENSGVEGEAIDEFASNKNIICIVILKLKAAMGGCPCKPFRAP